MSPLAVDDIAVVLTVSVAVTGAVPVSDSEAGIEQVGASAAPAGPPLTAQLSATLPVKPPLGDSIIVAVPLVPAVAIVIAELLLKVKLAGAGTNASTAVAAVMLPETPAIVTVKVPGLVVACVFTVSVAEAALPVTAADAGIEQVGGLTAPCGPPLTAHCRATLPVKPELGLTVIVAAPVPPAATLRDAAFGVSVKEAGLISATKNEIVSVMSPDTAVTTTV
jgi:hypothetical protein